jgi:CHAT domain-containing protein
VWIDTEGNVTPQYPWIDHDWSRREAEVKAAKFELPQLDGQWEHWEMGPGEPGLETMVLLCRDEPLPESVDLAGMLRGLGKVPLDGQDASAVSWFENGKTVRGEKQRAPLAKAVRGRQLARAHQPRHPAAGEGPFRVHADDHLRQHGGQVMARIMGMLVLMACAGASWAAGPPDRETWARMLLGTKLVRAYEEGTEQCRKGNLVEATTSLVKVLKLGEELYPRSRFPEGHSDLLIILNDLATLYEVQDEYARAEPLFLRSLAMRQRLYTKDRFPRGHPDLAVGLNNLGRLYFAMDDYAKAEPLLRRALEMYEMQYPKGKYPQGHPDLALSLNNLAYLYEKRGDYARAGPLHRRALAMYQAAYPPARHPEGHFAVAMSMHNLATLYEREGEYAKAETLFRRVMEMLETLYPLARFPQGHHALARGINDLANLHWRQDEYAKAEPLLIRALEMRETLYPKSRFPRGHTDIAETVNNLGLLHQARDDFAKAKPLLLRALEMRERLYPKDRFPKGHPHLALSLNNLAFLYVLEGEYAKAEPLFRRAAEMFEEKYPPARYRHGHPDVVQSMSNLAFLHLAKAEYERAEPLCRRAILMHIESAKTLAASEGEIQALNYLAAQPLMLDCYLSIKRHLPGTDAYEIVWQTKSALGRVSERTHLAVLAAASQEVRGLWDAVLSLKRERERLLLAPTNGPKVKIRDARLDEIDEQIRQKEAALLPLLPALKRSDDLAGATPADLRKALPADVAFIDLLRYTRFETDPKIPGYKGWKLTQSYLAFVVTRSAVVSVELGEAGPIEEALALWRRAIVEGSSSEQKYAAETYRLLWSPLVGHLPAKTSAVYVSPDAALNRVPWAALRNPKSDRILIEEYAVAAIPHGPMLLDRLTAPKRKAPDKPTLLAMGGVAYDGRPGTSSELATRGPAGDAVRWGPLAGTEKELRPLVALAGDRKVIRLEGSRADAAALLADLPLAETAHLATHGFFANKKFRTMFQLDPKLFARAGAERSSAGARSPLVLSGLVCAGANVDGTPNRGVVTADAIVGLDLRKLDLAVLSACETGLGDVAGGEGVYGLVRAFHVAGTRNVVASLWKVDDEATAALMVLFYRELWGKEKVTPMEALRRAQVAVYRDPGRIPEWAAGRGPLPGAVAGPKAAKGPRAKTSPARAWAAFVISGPGD